jgi:hypothetical protein
VDSTLELDSQQTADAHTLRDAAEPIADVALEPVLDTEVGPIPDAALEPVPDAEPLPIIDAGQPPPELSIAAAGEVQSTLVNGNANGGMRHVDICQDDAVMIGVAGEIRQGTDYIGRIQVMCGRVLVRNGMVGIEAGQPLPLRGALGGPDDFRSICQGGEAVVGYSGRAGALVDQLVMYCAPLVVQNDGITWNVSLPQMPVGGAGGNPFAQQSCLPGKVAVGAHIQAGDALDGFGIRCRSLVLAQ